MFLYRNNSQQLNELNQFFIIFYKIEIINYQIELN